MNKIFRVVWSVARQALVVVSELASARGKPSRPATDRRRGGSGAARAATTTLLLAGVPAAVLAQVAPQATQLPTGGQVVAGQADISQSGANLHIDQASERAVIDWRTFDVGAEATVHFHQPSADAVALNRVADVNVSRIFGRITADGQVFLSNPNGVYFAPGASVDVGGLVATTHAIRLDDFLAGRARFERNGAAGSVVNEGELRAALGGYIALLAPEVRNQGLVLANLGTVAMAAGEHFELQFDAGNSLAGLSVAPATLGALVENRSAVLAPGGLVILSARAVAAVQAAVVNSGEISASSLVERGGRLLLEGDDILLAAQSRLAATGATGGGEILVGGDWQGSGPMHQATRVMLEQGARIDASATTQGNGGKVVLWSDIHSADSVTAVQGSIAARGAGGGSGGQVETSGHTVQVDGARIDAGATGGQGGLWLLDPYDYVIDGTAAGTINASLNLGTSVTIDTANNSGAGAGASGSGDITVTAAVDKSQGGDATLTLKAARHIALQGGASFSSSSGRLNLLLWADSDNSGDGIIQNASPLVSTNGGWLRFGNDQTATINGAVVPVGGDVFFNGSAAQSIATGGGAVDIHGEAIIANIHGVSIETDGGNVGLHGVVNSGNRYTWVDKTGDTAHNWDWARNDAVNGTGGRAAIGDSYLVTITSRLENAIAGLTAGYRGAWIGAYRANPGASYAWTWSDGPEAGARFFTQAGAGGTTEPGWYSNFGSGEPNGALDANGESRGQFFGTGGQWNDLPATMQFSATQANQYSVLGYVRETNMATSPLSIDAGAGTVTFAAPVGNSKALASLDITSGLTVLNGGAVTTQGVQAYHGAVQLGAHTTFTTRNSDIVFGSTVDSASAAVPRNLTVNIRPDNTYYWADWTSATATSVSGTITIGTDVINITYDNPNGIAFAQTSGGTNYWTFTGGASPYVSANVANGPSTSDMVALRYAGRQTLTFSQSVENLAFSIISMNGNGYGFDQDFNIESHAGLNGAGAGYYGTGGFVKAVVSDTYQLNDAQTNSPSEPHGTIRFTGAFSDLSWQSLSNEFWNAFTVGVSGTSASAGAVHFNGTAGASAALGAINVSGAMQTTADVASAASLAVTGAARLGGDITTSGHQHFASAVVLDSDATLATTSHGNVTFAGTVDGAHDLGVATHGTGDVTFDRAVGGTTALTGLALNTDVLSAGALTLAPGAALTITNAGASAVAGVISGTNASVAKSGTGRLTLAGANTYSGGTSLTGGVLRLGAATSGGIVSGPLGTGMVTVGLNAALDLAGFSLANALNLSGQGYAGSGALFNSTAASVTVSGATTLAGDTTLSSESGGNLNLTGSLDGAHVLTIDASGASLDAAVTLAGVVGGNAPLAGLHIDSGAAGTTLAAAVTTAGPVSIRGGNIALDAALTAGGGSTVTLQGTGNVTDGASGRINAANLLLLGGNVTLDNSANAVDVLAAAGVGALTYVEDNTLTIGSIGSTHGIDAGGPVSIRTTTGDLALAGDVATTDASAAALVLNAGASASAGTAAGGNLILSGSPAVTVGAGGTARLYSGAINGSSGLGALVGLGSGRFRYNSDEMASNFTLGLATGLNAIYREQPTVTLSAVDETVVYGNAPVAATSANSHNGDTVAQILAGSATVSVGGALSSSGHFVAGDHVLAISVLGGDQLGYSILGHAPGTLTVTPRDLTYTGVVATRSYDGSTAASVTDAASGWLLGDEVSAVSTSAQFSVDGNAGMGKTVAVGGISLTGADRDNYRMASTATATGNITPRTVSLTGQKVYDGTSLLAPGAVSIVTGVGNETLGYSGATALHTHVASTGNHILGITLLDAADASGGLAANYVLPTLDAAHAPVTITPRPLTASAGIGGATGKTYDGNALASGATLGGTLAGAIAGDLLELDFAGVGLLYDSSHVAHASRIDAVGNAAFSIGSSASGSQASDYLFTAPVISPVAGSITPALLTATLVNAGVAKVYDGTTAAPAGFLPQWSLAGLVGGDTSATLASSAAIYDSSHVDAASAITVSGLSITGIAGSHGSLASDYALAATHATAAAAITPRPVTVTGLVAADKVYDGSAAAVIEDWGRISTGVGSQTLQVSAAGALFAGADAGHAITVTATGYALADGQGIDGGRASDYRLTSTSATTSGDILPASLIIKANDDAKFVTHDDAAAYAGVTYSGFVNGETAAVLGGTLAIARSNAGTNAAGRYRGVLVPAGATSTNYAITYAAGDYLVVPAEELLVTIANVSTTYGSAGSYTVIDARYLDGGNVLKTLALTAANGDTYTFDDGEGGTATFTVAPSEAATSTSGHLAAGHYALAGSGVLIGGANFDALHFVGNQAVQPKAIAASASGVSKIYDGNTSMTNLELALAGVENGDVVRVNGTGSFSQHDVGTGLDFEVSDMVVTGADGANYVLVGGSSLSGSDGVITPATLTVGGIRALDKTYDGSASAGLVTQDATFAGLVAGDDVRLDSVSGTFEDKNAGSGKRVALTSTYAGSDLGNYLIEDQRAATATIGRLASVTWVGGPGGNWFDPANWAGGAVPDLANVAHVVIPAGVTVRFDVDGVVAPAQAAPVHVESLGTAGGLRQIDGELNVAGGVTLASFTQTGGTLAVGGDLAIQREFGQAGRGSVIVGGNADLRDVAGTTSLGNLEVRGRLDVHSSGGDIVQAPGTRVVAGGRATLEAPGYQVRIAPDNVFAGGLSFGENLPQILPPAAPAVAPQASAGAGVAAVSAVSGSGAGSVQTSGNGAVVVEATAPTTAGADIQVSLVRQPAAEQEGLVRVDATQQAIEAGLRFQLPRRVVDAVPAGATFAAALPDGTALPSWLAFDPATAVFTVSPAQAHGLPITVMVEGGGRRWRVVVSRVGD